MKIGRQGRSVGERRAASVRRVSRLQPRRCGGGTRPGISPPGGDTRSDCGFARRIPGERDGSTVGRQRTAQLPCLGLGRDFGGTGSADGPGPPGGRRCRDLLADGAGSGASRASPAAGTRRCCCSPQAEERALWHGCFRAGSRTRHRRRASVGGSNSLGGGGKHRGYIFSGYRELRRWFERGCGGDSFEPISVSLDVWPREGALSAPIAA